MFRHRGLPRPRPRARFHLLFSWKEESKLPHKLQTTKTAVHFFGEGRQAVQELAGTMMQFITTTAASGIGLDTPSASPQQDPPAIAVPPTSREGGGDADEEGHAEDKGEYKMEDEDEAMDEDHSFDYVPEEALDSCDSSSYVQAEAKEDVGIGQEESKEISPPGHDLTSGGTVDMGVSPTSDTFSMEKLSIKQHVVIQNTVIMEEYAKTKVQGITREDTPSKVLGILQAPIAAATSSGLTASVGSFTHKETAVGKAGTTKSKVANYPGEGAEEQEGHNAMDISPVAMGELPNESPHEQEYPHVIARCSDGNTNSGATAIVTSNPPTPLSMKRDGDSLIPRDSSAHDTSSVDKTLPSKVLVATPDKIPKHRQLTKHITPQKRRKLSSGDGGGSFARKKPRKLPSTLKESASPLLRRSQRIKIEPPRYGSPAKKHPAVKKLLADETVMYHFDRDNGTANSTEMRCKYCQEVLTASRGEAASHLKACPAFTRQGHLAPPHDDEENKTQPPAFVQPRTTVTSEMQPTKLPMRVHTSSDSPLSRLLGSEELAGKLSKHVPFVGHESLSRFQALIKDNVTGLRHLSVQDLLDAVDPMDDPATVIRVHFSGVRRTGEDKLDSAWKAKARDLEDYPLRFSAPRSVAEYFILPLAKQLGLEYAMHQHTAKFVSCPQTGTILDWRFHKTETVVFQLRGKTLWKTKMSPAHHPVRCFHPESWRLEDVSELSKVHRVASMSRSALSSLAPPFDDVRIFDGRESDSDNASLGMIASTEQLQEYILKPGSVVYLPAGMWFETETKGKNSLWLEVQLAPVASGMVALSALMQLAWRDDKFRIGLSLQPGSRNGANSARQRMEGCLQALRHRLASLEASDLLPEYMFTDDLRKLVADGAIIDTSESPMSMRIEVDLRNPRLKVKHVKVFKESRYRVNPVAVLMNVDEIPYLDRRDETSGNDAAAMSPPTLHRVLNKTPKPKSKRRQVLRALAHADEHIYVLDELFGNHEFRSRLHAKITCSSDQAKMIEWLRSRGTELFNVEDFSRGNDWVLRLNKSAAQCEEAARQVLRFLCLVGYVSHVKPL